MITVFAKSSNYFFMRISFFCIALFVQIKYYKYTIYKNHFTQSKTVFIHLTVLLFSLVYVLFYRSLYLVIVIKFEIYCLSASFSYKI